MALSMRITVVAFLVLLQGEVCRTRSLVSEWIANMGPSVPPDSGNTIFRTFSLRNDIVQPGHLVQSVVAGPGRSFYVLFGPKSIEIPTCLPHHGLFFPVPNYPRLHAPVVRVDYSGETENFSTTNWGANLLEAPVKMVRDPSGSMWFLDTHRHQVIKQTYESDNSSALTIGIEHSDSTNAGDYTRLCHPRDIAIAPDGRIFIADGCFCMRKNGDPNRGRVLMYDASGTFLLDLSAQTDDNPMSWSPNSALTLGSNGDELYVGKHNTGEVFAVNASNGSFTIGINDSCTDKNWRLAKSTTSNVLYAAIKGSLSVSNAVSIFSIRPGGSVVCRRIRSTGMYELADMSLSTDGNDILYVVTNLKMDGPRQSHKEPMVYVFN